MLAELRQRYPEARLLGWQTHEAARMLIRNARAMVFPSLWYEGQPLTVLEAKSLGTPVIISDGCAGRDDIADNEAGYWFRSGDADNLASAIERVSDDATVRRLSLGAYQGFWVDPPTLDRHVAAIVSIYRGLTAAARAPAIAA